MQERRNEGVLFSNIAKSRLARWILFIPRCCCSSVYRTTQQQALVFNRGGRKELTNEFSFPMAKLRLTRWMQFIPRCGCSRYSIQKARRKRFQIAKEWRNEFLRLARWIRFYLRSVRQDCWSVSFRFVFFRFVSFASSLGQGGTIL